MDARDWYYAVWADGLTAIEHSKTNLPNRDGRMVLLVMFSVAQGLNLSTLLILFGPWFKTGLTTPDLGLGVVLNNLLMGLCVYIGPFVVLNYLLVFHKDKYKKLVKPSPGGRKYGWLFMGYFLLSSILFLGLLVVGKALS
jgi:hypothetical protein